MVIVMVMVMGGAVLPRKNRIDRPDFSWKGWGKEILKYEASRKPDQHYGEASLREAIFLYIETRVRADHPRTHHWATVRLINEIMMLDRMNWASWEEMNNK